jgi:hypothetical protein
MSQLTIHLNATLSAIKNRSHNIRWSDTKFTHGHACIFFHQQLQKALALLRRRRRKRRATAITIEHNADVYRECVAMYRADMWYTRFRRAF